MKKLVFFVFCLLVSVFSFAENNSVKIAGYTLTECDGEYKLTAPCIENFGKEELVIKDLKLKEKRIVSGGNVEIADEFISYKLNEWNVNFYSLRLTKNGLEGYAAFQNRINENEFTYIAFENFKLYADGSFDAGIISQEEGAVLFSWNHFCFEFENIKFIKNNKTGIYEFTAEDSFVRIPYEDDSYLKFGKAVITSNGLCLAESKKKYSFSFVSMNGYDIKTDEVAFKEGRIAVTGSIAPCDWTEKGVQRIKIPGEIIIQPDFTAYSSHFDVSCDYSFADWNIHGTGFEFGREFMNVDSNKIHFREVELDLGKIVYYSDGSLYDTAIDGQDCNIKILSDESLIKMTRFGEEGLYVSMEVVFPEELGGSIIEYMSVELKQDGKFSVDVNIEHKPIDLGYMNFDLNYLSLSDEELYIDDASINIPELQNFKFGVEGLSISMDGKIKLKGGFTYPFRLFNMVFIGTDLTFDDNLLDFRGSVSLPKELPGILSARTTKVDKFQIGFDDGKLKKLEAKLEGDYVVPLTNELSLSCSGVSLTNENELPVIYFDKAKVILPSYFEEDVIDIAKARMVYNGNKFEFDWDAMDIDDIIETAEQMSRKE